MLNMLHNLLLFGRNDRDIDTPPPDRERFGAGEGFGDAPDEPQGPRPLTQFIYDGGAPQPIVTYSLIAIIGVIFVTRFFPGDWPTELLLWGIADVDQIVNEGEVYRLFTAMFLHLNVLHIFFNALALYSFGRTVERYFGSLRFLLIYLLGGFLGSVFMLLAGTGGLGASGAVFAILGAEAVFLYRHLDLFGEQARSQFRSLIFLTFLNFFIGFSANAAATFDTSGTAVRISNAAHFGGLLGGAILTYFLSPLLTILRTEQQTVQVQRQNGGPSLAVLRRIFLQDENPLEKTLRFVGLYSVGLVVLLFLSLFWRS